jgi:hypothetical protein
VIGRAGVRGKLESRNQKLEIGKEKKGESSGGAGEKRNGVLQVVLHHAPQFVAAIFQRL